MSAASQQIVAHTVQPPVALRNGMLSPKRPSSETDGLADIFPYYAGFSFTWARAQLLAATGESPAAVLDPWNGSGTTTLAAQSNGLRSIGIDRNPIANVVAQLRVTATAVPSPLAAPARTAIAPTAPDPLSAWLADSTVNRLRTWTRALSLDPPMILKAGSRSSRSGRRCPFQEAALTRCSRQQRQSRR